MLPWIAIATSLLSLSVACVNSYRDRAVLKVTSTYSEDWEGFHACVRINIVNTGRRPIILSRWVGAETKRGRLGRRSVSNWMGTYFDPKDALTLGEHQPHTFQLESDEILDMLPDGEVVVFDDMWIMDTVGRRHKIKGIRENIASLRQWTTKQSPPLPA